jgi:hypothetical protein
VCLNENNEVPMHLLLPLLRVPKKALIYVHVMGVGTRQNLETTGFMHLTVIHNYNFLIQLVVHSMHSFYYYHDKFA